MLRRLTPCLLLACFLTALPQALTAEDAATPAAVDDLGWIVGQWRGDKGDSVVEEQWSATGAGVMMGMFRWFSGDQVRLYEFMLLEPTANGPVLRIKHFGSGLRGWEEKDESVDFHLIEHRKGLAVFERDPEIEDAQLVYRLTEDDQLEVRLLKTKDGKESVTGFLFERQ